MEKIKIYFTDSYDSISSHALLVKSASLYTDLPENGFVVNGKKGEKPYFESHPDVHFSISHSGTLWACAFAHNEVGLDVQDKNHNRNCIKLAERFFNPSEYAIVKASIDINDKFTEIWARKEAVVKLFGIGIDSRFKRFDSLPDAIHFLDSDVYIKNVHISDNAATAVACRTIFEVEIIKI